MEANSLLSNHKTELEALQLKFKDYCHITDPFFKLDSSKHGTTTYVHKDATTGTPIIKSERIIQSSLENIFNLLILDDDATKHWDTACEDALVFSIGGDKILLWILSN